MFKIQVLNKIATVGLEQFPRHLYEISANMPNPDAILVRSQTMHDFPMSNSIKAIGRAGIGVNNIPVADLTERGIPVFNTPGANANAVRELVIAGMLLASRNICQAWNYVSQLQTKGNEFKQKIEKEKNQFVGFELLGKTLGIIGLGSIGVKVANAAAHLGMRVVGYDPTIAINHAWALSSNVEKAHNIDDLLMEADFVSFHVPLTDQTRNMINSSRFSLMKKNVVILNFARDEIIDIDALKDALNEKRIFAYVSDFPNEKLQNIPSVICLPHLGASTKEAEENCAVMIANQVRDFLEYGAITNSANFPSVEVTPHISGVRLAIVNANVPNMVAQISAKLAEVGLNISSLINKSRGQIAYTLIDVQEEVHDAILKNIENVNGIIQVRKIASIN